MKILTTATLLVVTLLIVPVISYTTGTALSPLEMKALSHVMITAAVVALLCFILGEITGNTSQVDKIWSLMPIVYTWTVAAYGDYSPRLVMMSILVTIWGLRLTYNFSRHGAYKLKFWQGKEDYRWEILRQKKEFQPPWKWSLFNFFFISGYQNALILLFSLPIIVAFQNRNRDLTILDYGAAALMIFFIIFETIADNQQWQYQSTKWIKINKGEEVTGSHKKGFLDTGLWSLSRHPNYFAEQSIWIAFYLFSVAASGQWINWSIAGCLLLLILFQNSSIFSEEISAGKYPEYAEYQQRVRRFLPIPKRDQ